MTCSSDQHIKVFDKVEKPSGAAAATSRMGGSDPNTRHLSTATVTTANNNSNNNNNTANGEAGEAGNNAAPAAAGATNTATTDDTVELINNTEDYSDSFNCEAIVKNFEVVGIWVKSEFANEQMINNLVEILGTDNLEIL